MSDQGQWLWSHQPFNFGGVNSHLSRKPVIPGQTIVVHRNGWAVTYYAPTATNLKKLADCRPGECLDHPDWGAIREQLDQWIPSDDTQFLEASRIIERLHAAMFGQSPTVMVIDSTATYKVLDQPEVAGITQSTLVAPSVEVSTARPQSRTGLLDELDWDELEKASGISKGDRARYEFAKPYRDKDPPITWDTIADLYHQETGERLDGPTIKQSCWRHGKLFQQAKSGTYDL